jgi:uncharacterized protein YfaP (DUF2135 family)
VSPILTIGSKEFMARRYSSRLSRRSEEQSKKNFFLSIIGILAVLFVFFHFILPLLLNASSVISQNKDNGTKKSSNNFISPPFLNQTYTATNSAQVSISGTALPKETVKLIVNGSTGDSTQTKDDGTFTFSNISLTSGQNSITAKAKNDKGDESDFSNQITITYSNKQPSLTIDSPSDGQSFQKAQNSITVSGKTDSGDKVTVNGFWAIVDDNGQYTYTLALQNGDNKIEVISTDSAGNQTKLTKTVKYSS